MSRLLRQWLLVLFSGFALLLAFPAPATGQQAGALYLVELDGVVTSVSTGYVRRALREAEAASVEALIIRLGSQGGVLRELRALARELHDAKVPVVVYVAPEGTASGAAGALLLSAAHIAVMAPNTSFGSPYPLAQLDNILLAETRQLLLDDLSGQLREWNRERGRGTDWVERGVGDGVVVSNQQAAAAEPPAVNLVAPSIAELPALLDGRVVTLADGTLRTLRTLGADPTPVVPTAWEQLRLLLANPTVAFLLFVLGGVAIYCELANPGSTLFAGLGLVLLAASIFGGLLVLPVRPLAIVGLILAFGLLAADLFAPSHGGLTVAALAVLVVSGLNLLDPLQAPGAGVALWALGAVVAALGSLAVAGMWLVVRAQSRPLATGSEGLVGKLAEARQPLDPEGLVFVDGALWRAVSADGQVEKGDWVRVTAVEGLRLIVQRLE